MAEGQRKFATQRAAYRANFVMYPGPPGQPPPIPMRKSESALSLSVSRPLPPRLQQRRGTVCTTEMVRVESNTTLPPMPGHGPPPPMAGHPMRRSYMVTSFAEPPSAIADRGSYGPYPRYGRPYSPPPLPPPGARRSASGRRSPVRRLRRAYDDNEDDCARRCRNRGHDDDDDDDDDDYEYAERSRRQVPAVRRSRSRKDAARPAKSTMSRSGSRLRMLRIEREISDTGSTKPGASSTVASRIQLDDTEAAGSCVCICGSSRSPSRGRVSGIYIKSQRELDAEELYVVKRIKDKKGRKKKRKKPPPTPPAPPAQQPGLMGYLCNLVGIGNEEAQPQPLPPSPPPAATDSDTDDGDEYELKRLDRAELARLCRQMGVNVNADEPEKK